MEDYSRVGGQKKERKGKVRRWIDRQWRAWGKKVCLYTSESDDRGCWEISVGNYLMASIWSRWALQCHHSPHLSSPLLPSAHKTERGGTQSVDPDRAGEAINKVSLLFMACSEHHSREQDDRGVFYRLQGKMQMPDAHARQTTTKQGEIVCSTVFIGVLHFLGGYGWGG